MGIKLTPEVLAAAYDLLLTLEPFVEWNLPPSEDVRFKVIRSVNNRGWYKFDNNWHTIAISQRCVGHTISLIEVMAHEMLHLHQRHNCLETSGMHNKSFLLEAERICAIHGFDPALF